MDGIISDFLRQYQEGLPEDIERWRHRAEECRTMADCAINSMDARKTLIAIAECYEAMADRVERRIVQLSNRRA